MQEVIFTYILFRLVILKINRNFTKKKFINENFINVKSHLNLILNYYGHTNCNALI